jgi:hypothetical protein
MQRDNLNPLHENSCTCYRYGHQGYNHTQVLLVWVLVVPFLIDSMEISQFSWELQARSVLVVLIFIVAFLIVSMEIFRFSWVTIILGSFASGCDFLYCERRFLNSHALFILVLLQNTGFCIYNVQPCSQSMLVPVVLVFGFTRTDCVLLWTFEYTVLQESWNASRFSESWREKSRRTMFWTEVGTEVLWHFVAAPTKGLGLWHMICDHLGISKKYPH